MKHLLIVLTLMLAACSRGDIKLRWIEATPEEIELHCGEKKAGCSRWKEQGDDSELCVIYTPFIPAEGFTATSEALPAETARTVTHELMHCKYHNFHG